MGSTQVEKGQRFQALHVRPGAFVIPNPWDAGTARILAALGFEALTTTSAGLAFALGKRDGVGQVTREETLANARAIAEATDLPVAADLENGFGDAPETAAETIRLAGETAGLVGGSIEDSTQDPRWPLYDFQHAVERVAAAAEAAHRLPFPFVLVGRAESYLHGNPDLDDTIRRLQAYAAAGARCPLRAGDHPARGHPHPVLFREQARQCADGSRGGEELDVLRGGARRAGCQAHQPGLRAESCSPRSLPPRGARNQGEGDIHIRRAGAPLRGGQRFHDALEGAAAVATGPLSFRPVSTANVPLTAVLHESARCRRESKWQ